MPPRGIYNDVTLPYFTLYALQKKTDRNDPNLVNNSNLNAQQVEI